MTIRIPHSLDAVIQAVEALIDGRPMPDDWSREPESPSVVEPVPEPVPEVPFGSWQPNSVDEEVPSPAGWNNFARRMMGSLADGPLPEEPVFDEALIAQAIRDLIDKKVSDLPQPKEPDLQPILDRLQQLETAFASLPDGFSEAVLLNLDIQKSQTIANTDLERRVAAVETIIAGLSSAIHKEGAA